MDEILPEVLKAQVLKAFLVNTPLQHCVVIGDCAFRMTGRCGGSLFQEGRPEDVFQLTGITLLSLPGKVYSRVLERRMQLLVEPRSKEEQCGFCPGCGTLDQLYNLVRILEGA